MKQLILRIMVFVLILTSVNVPSYAQENKSDTMQSGTRIYETYNLKKKMVGVVPLSESTAFIQDKNVVAAQIRDAMLARERSVTVYYDPQGQLEKGDFTELVLLAMEECDNSSGGDYLAKHYDTIGIRADEYLYAGNDYKYIIVIDFKYYTTAAQERTLDAAVKDVFQSIGISDQLSDYEKVFRIYDYVCKNVKYDYKNLENEEYDLKYTAYAALINKTAVCQGYASLMYKMLKEAGIDCRIISGESSGEAHGWNIVKLGSKYYYLDATWDANYVGNYQYFLKGSNNFDNHLSDEEYLTSDFKKQYPISKTDYGVQDEVENPFEDVRESQYYYQPVLWAVENNITTGLSATIFGPEEICTRGQVVTFLWRSAGCPEPVNVESPFIDVQSYNYYYKAVLWAVKNGITTGESATWFGAESPCTRSQVVTFLWRATGEPEPRTSDCVFEDVTAESFYRDAVIWAVENGITSGMSATRFAPHAPCTRGQIVTFLYRYFN